MAKNVPFRLKFIVGLASLLLLTSVSFKEHAFADTVRIAGVDFPVDEISVLEGGKSRVRVFGQSRIIARGNVHPYIVESYFSRNHPGTEMSVAATEEFIRRTLSSGEVGLARVALVALLDKSVALNATRLEFLKSLSVDRNAIELFKATLLSPEATNFEPQSLSLLILEIGIKEQSWLRTAGLSLVYLAGADLRALVTSEFERTLIANDLTRSRQIVEVVLQLYGDLDSSYEGLKVLLGRADSINDAFQKGSITDVFPILELCQRDPQQKKLFQGIFTTVLHQASEGALSKNQPDRAIVYLSHLEPAWRINKTRELLRLALGKIDGSNASLALDAAVMTLLLGSTAADPELKASLIHFLDLSVIALLNQGSIRQAEASFVKLRSLRADPSEENDAIRLRFAFSYIALGLRSDAEVILKEMHYSPSFLDRISLLQQGYYFDLSIILNILVFPLLLLTLFALYRNYRYRRARVLEQDRAQTENKFSAKERVDTSGPQGFSKFVSARFDAFDPRRGEYKQSLAVLGLEFDASLSDIKIAYRSSVKEVHPDRPVEEKHRGEASEEFLKITEAYQRALQLRKELKMDDE